VDANGALHPVNAISGDMFKHIQAEHLFHLAQEQGLPLCDGCQRFDANRINGDDGFPALVPSSATDGEILDLALQRCTIDDLEGILITRKLGGKKRAIGRKSVVEFGWVVGRPETTRTDSYFHVKYVPEGRGKGSGDESGANVGQNIFHRPASSGQYAVVVNLDLFRIGLNDITLEYAIDEGERLRRARALIQSLLHTFVKPTGAHRNTQNPHLVAIEGVLATSDTTTPAPTVSPLNPDYVAEIESVAQALNGQNGTAITTHRFTSLSELAAQLTSLARDLSSPEG